MRRTIEIEVLQKTFEQLLAFQSAIVCHVSGEANSGPCGVSLFWCSLPCRQSEVISVIVPLCGSVKGPESGLPSCLPEGRGGFLVLAM